MAPRDYPIQVKLTYLSYDDGVVCSIDFSISNYMHVLWERYRDKCDPFVSNDDVTVRLLISNNLARSS